MLRNWIILLGQTILTNAASQNIIESRINNNIININSKEVKCAYNPTIYNIEKIKEIINQVYLDHNVDINTIIKNIKDLENKLNELKKD